MPTDRRTPKGEPAAQTAHQAGASADAARTFDVAHDALAAGFPADSASAILAHSRILCPDAAAIVSAILVSLSHSTPVRLAELGQGGGP